MTLIIALMAPTQAILVSDRRLTENGRLFDDEKNKATVLFCADGRAAVAFTGLALAPTERFDTSRVLLQVLSQAGLQDHLLLPTIQRFTVLITEEFKKLKIPQANKHVTFVFSGYRYAGSMAAPVLAQVTNTVDMSGMFQKSASEEFRMWTPREPRPFVFLGFGVKLGVASANPERLKELLLQQRPAEALVNKAVEVIRKAADSPRSKGLVGKQCMSIVVPLQGPVFCNYHSATVKNQIFLPNSVVSTPNAAFTSQGTSIEQLDAAGPPLVVPKVGRNHPCPCGSGKKYKRCHGRAPTVRIP